MKKFTNIEKIEKLKEIKPKLNKLVEKLAALNLSVSYSGNSNDIIGKNINIDGVDKLVESLNNVIKKSNDGTYVKLTETLKYSSIINNHEMLNNEISRLNEQKHADIIYSPEDIFESNDYKKSEKLFILESLNTIPVDYLAKLNNVESQDYFSNGNKVSIIYEGINKGWKVSFINNDKYGISADDKNEKYNKFIKENAEFIADFISATSNLIGAKNLKLENKLIK
jgi:hypothetical protein